MKAMVQAPRDRAASPEAHEGGAPARPKKRAAVQWAPRSLLGFDSLTMSSPGDASEREADAAAQRLVRGLPAQVGALPRVGVQRRCAACASAPATPCATCGTREEEPPPIVQRRATGIRSAFLGIPVVPFGGGAPLPGEVRSTFGRLLGHDLSGVRVHTGVEAARSAEGLSAEAYTVGDDVVFAAGRYAPQTPRGRELLAHELAHVAQQRGGAPRIQRQVSSARRPPSSCEAPSALTSQGGPLSVYRFVRGTTTFIDDLSDAARRYPPTARVIIHGAASEEEWQGVSPAESLRRNQRLACERALAARAVFAFQAPEVRVEHVVNHGQLSGDAEWHRIVAIEALPSQRPPHSEPPQEVRGPEPPPARRPSIDAGLPPLHPAHTCGPNITESFRLAVTEIRAAFIARGDDTRTACAWATFESQDSWDIEELYGSTLSSNAARYVAPSGCGFSDLPVRYGGCFPTVQVEGGCYETGTVNYVLYGIMGALCVGRGGPPLSTLERNVVSHKNGPTSGNTEYATADCLAWVRSGWAFGAGGALTPPPSQQRQCLLCETREPTWDATLTVRWCGVRSGTTGACGEPPRGRPEHGVAR